MKSESRRKTLFLYTLFLFLALVMNGAVAAQEEEALPPGPDVTLYVTEGNLTLYVAYPQPISLDGFEFSVVQANNDIFFSRLEARFDLRIFGEDRLIPPETCFIYQYDEDAPTPDVCRDTRTFFAPVGRGDRFWYNANGERRDIAITRNRDTTFQFCPANLDECGLFYSIEEPNGNGGSAEDNAETANLGLGLNGTPNDPRDRIATRTLDSQRGVIEELAWSPDDRYLVSGHGNGDLCVWSLMNSTAFEPLDCINGAHTGGILAVDWNTDPETPRVATTGADGVVRVWEVDPTAEAIIHNVVELSEDGHQSFAVDVDWSPDGTQIISAGTSRLIVWDVASEERLSAIQSNQPGVAEWRSDGRYLLTIDNIGVIRVVDSIGREGGVIIETYPASVAGVDAVWNPTFSSLATLDSGGNVRIYEYIPGTLCDTANPCDAITIAQSLPEASQMRFSPAGNRIAVSAQSAIHVMEAQSPYQLIKRYVADDENVDVNFTSFDWNTDGTQIAASDDRGRVYLWDAVAEVPQRLQQLTRWEATLVLEGEADELTDLAPILAFDWNQNGREVALVDANRNLSVWDAGTSRRLGSSQSHPRLPLAIDWNQERDFIGTGGCGPMAIIWAERANPQFILDADVDDLFCVSDLAFNPAGDLLAIANEGGVIRFWDWGEEVELSSRQLEFEISDLEWDSTGTRLASVNDNGLLIVFDVVNNRVSQTFSRNPHNGNGTALTAVVWSPDALRVATASANGDVVIWDLASGDTGTTRGGLVLSGHTSPVVGLSWTVLNDRNLLVSADESGRIIVWDARTGQRVAQTLMEITPVDVKWSPFREDGVFALADTNGFMTLWRFFY